MNKYSVRSSVVRTSLSFVTHVHNASRQHINRPATGCTVRLQSVRLCYGLRGIRPIRFEIRFERKKTIRRSLLQREYMRTTISDVGSDKI